MARKKTLVQFNRTNVQRVLSVLIARYDGPHGSANIDPQDKDGVVQMELGNLQLLRDVLETVGTHKGALSRKALDGILNDSEKKACAQVGIRYDSHTGYAQCRGKNLMVWFWYGYFRKAHDLPSHIDWELDHLEEKSEKSV